MRYALNLAEDGRILSATFEKYAPADAVKVDELPKGNAADYLYIDGEYVYNPLPKPEEPKPQATQEERIAELEAALEMLLSGVTE